MLYDTSCLIFLSTLSLRRATIISQRIFIRVNNFYPRSPCGERHSKCRYPPAYTHFYPRSPCGERLNQIPPRRFHYRFLSTLSLRRATLAGLWVLLTRIFLSTLSLRRATYDTYAKVLRVNISIHALLAESDPPTSRTRQS